MKRKDIQALHKKSESELTKEISLKREALLKLKLEMSTGKIKNIRMKARLQDELARLLTVQKEKQIQERFKATKV